MAGDDPTASTSMSAGGIKAPQRRTSLNANGRSVSDAPPHSSLFGLSESGKAQSVFGDRAYLVAFELRALEAVLSTLVEGVVSL